MVHELFFVTLFHTMTGLWPKAIAPRPTKHINKININNNTSSSGVRIGKPILKNLTSLDSQKKLKFFRLNVPYEHFLKFKG